MRNILVSSRLHALDNKVDVALKVRLAVVFKACIRRIRLARCEMLAKDHIIHGIIGKKPVLRFHEFGNILRLKSNIYFYIGGIFPFQLGKRSEIVVKLIGAHSCTRNIAVSEHPRTMVRESQHLHSVSYCALDIFPVLTSCVLTSFGMCMIIC